MNAQDVWETCTRRGDPSRCVKGYMHIFRRLPPFDPVEYANKLSLFSIVP